MTAAKSTVKSAISIFWYRRDLRLHDNRGLFSALNSGNKVLPLFIFDKDILENLDNKKDARLVFIYNQLIEIRKVLRQQQSDILIAYGRPEEVFSDLLSRHSIKEVHTNTDYEPYARNRDKTVAELLKKSGVAFKSFKDQVIFEKDEILRDNNKPYIVFTPYSKKWLENLNELNLVNYNCVTLFQNLFSFNQSASPSLEDMGFEDFAIKFPPKHIEENIIKDYSAKRDFPAESATSRLSVHLRFGTISIRQVVTIAKNLSNVWLKELIWREFYMSILWHFPHVTLQSFRKEYDRIPWRNNEEEFKLWCEGKTGYPMVDAGMRELNQTGFMHNRVRMVVASFLTKHLLIDWRWGEAYFAANLLDYELASNNGGWQWAAGTGVDAAPYFRIFNPQLQLEKFDPQRKYVQKWLPEFGTPAYTGPIVDHKLARERALKVYKKALE